MNLKAYQGYSRFQKGEQSSLGFHHACYLVISTPSLTKKHVDLVNKLARAISLRFPIDGKSRTIIEGASLRATSNSACTSLFDSPYHLFVSTEKGMFMNVV